MAKAAPTSLEDSSSQALEALREGGVILTPTDTVWGLSCDAKNPQAIQQVDIIKNRKSDKNYLVLVSSDKMLMRYVENIPDLAWEIMELSEKPVTIIYDDVKGLPVELLAEDGSLGIRVIKKGALRNIIERFGGPVLSTSANISGEPTPQVYKDISTSILENVNFILNLQTENEDMPNRSSSIIKLSADGRVKVIRQ